MDQERYQLKTEESPDLTSSHNLLAMPIRIREIYRIILHIGVAIEGFGEVFETYSVLQCLSYCKCSRHVVKKLASVC